MAFWKTKRAGKFIHDLSENGYAAGLTLLFVVISGIVAVHHELWGDEVQAWLISRDSSSPMEILKILKYEGHPGVWYLCLFLLTRFSSSLFLMQVLHLGIAAFSVYLFTRFSPFTRVQKALFAFGYFPFFEYAIICRSYAIGLALLLLFCVLFPKRTERFPLLGFLLFLIAHTSVHALIIVISMGLALFIDFWLTRDGPGKAKAGLGFFWILLGVVTATLQLNPPPECSINVPWKTDLDLDYLLTVLNLIPTVFFPIPEFTFHFWNTNFLDSIPASEAIKFLLACLILLYRLFLLAARPASFFLYLVGTVGLCAFFYTKSPGLIRHHGFLFVLFICSLWISKHCKERIIPVKFGKKLNLFLENSSGKVLTVLLFFHLIGGITAASMDLMHPFSQAESVARFIRARGMGKIPIVGVNANTLSGYLERQFYYPSRGGPGSFQINDDQAIFISEYYYGLKAIELSLREKQDCLLILKPNPMTEDVLVRFPIIKKLARFDRSIVKDERYYLYFIPYDLASKMYRSWNVDEEYYLHVIHDDITYRVHH